MDSTAQDVIVAGVDRLGMPQRKRRRREENELPNSVAAVPNDGHPLFLVMIKCPVAECSVSVSSDHGSSYLRFDDPVHLS